MVQGFRGAATFMLLGLAAGDPAFAEKPRGESPVYTGQGITLYASVRSAEQMTAFYTGRGFPPAMLHEIDTACFITVGVKHTRKEVIWLEPSRWRFVDGRGNNLHRLDRNHWNHRWENIFAPAASRATFGWTQLPESRDLQPGEPVGGNVTLERPVGEFALELVLPTGADRTGKPLTVRVPGLKCDNGTRSPGAGKP
jgi:hypothetical protein